MDLIWEKFTEWLKELLVGGIMDNLTGLFDNVNAKVAEAAGHIGSTPQAWNANIYSMIRSLSDNVILPIAGVILAFVMTLELIQLIPYSAPKAARILNGCCAGMSGTSP